MLPLKVGIVNYLNTKPLLYGLTELEKDGIIELHYDFPAQTFQKFADKITDIALLPVATLKHLPQAHIIGNHCIAADNAVASVCLYSHVAVQDIQKIYLDYQSRTSVELIKILCREYWKINPEFIAADTNYIENITGTTAGIIIGDRALQNNAVFPFVYDLASAWISLTNLPFVFAVWCTQVDIEYELLNAFEQANEKGLSVKHTIAANNAVAYYDLEKYYTDNIVYTLDDNKRKAIDLFLSKI